MAVSKVDRLLEKVKELSDEEYRVFLCNVFDYNRPAEINRAIVKKITKCGSKDVKMKGGVDSRGNSMSCPPSSPTAFQQSAWKSPLIIRGDLIKDEDVFAFDVEKISLKPGNEDKKHKMVAETVAVVNKDGELVFWAFLKWPEEKICQLFPSMTGFSREKIKIGIDSNKVGFLLKFILKGKLLVGYDLKSDLESLGIEHNNVDDVSEYFSEDVNAGKPFHKPDFKKYKLKDVYEHFYPGKSVQCGVHSAVSDARISMDVWKVKEKLKAEYPQQLTYFKNINRSSLSAYVYDKNDVCTCKKTKKRNM